MKEMKNVTKKLLGLVLIMALAVGVFAVETPASKAASIYDYGYFAVTSLTSTSASFDWSNLAVEYANDDKTILAYELYDTTSSTEVLLETLPVSRTTYTVNYLIPFSVYAFTVKPVYVYAGDNDQYKGYEYVVFTTPAGTGGTTNPGTGTGINPGTTTDPGTTVTPPSTIAVAPSITSIQSVKMVGETVTVAVNPVQCSGYEVTVYNKKTNAVVSTQTSASSTIYLTGISRNNVYYAKVRACNAYTSGYLYSELSAPKYFIPQPKINSSTSKMKKNSIVLKWGKVNGASSYTIYMRKRYTNKWTKVTTVKGNKSNYTIKKFKGKKFSTTANNYELMVKSSVKIGATTYNSTTNDYIYTYTYRYYK